MGPAFFLTWIFLSVMISFMADSRGRNGLAWFMIALLTSPPFAFIVLLVTKNLVDEKKKEQERKEEKEMQIKQIEALAKKSPADELLKLAELKERGIITEQEFNKQKTAILLA